MDTSVPGTKVPNLQAPPPRGILRNKGEPRTQIMWDEENIKATYHPEGKDYGHMKIDEANTPYESPLIPEEDLNIPELSLGESTASASAPPKDPNPVHAAGDWESDDDMQAEDAPETMDKFKEARKQHYNMKAAMMEAKRLMAEIESSGDDESENL